MSKTEVLGSENLEIIVKDQHFIVSDGCEIDSEESNILGDESGNRFDSFSRSSSSKGAKRHLLMRNVGIIGEYYYKGDRELELKCPICKRIYRLTKEDFHPAFEEYQKVMEEG